MYRRFKPGYILLILSCLIIACAVGCAQASISPTETETAISVIQDATGASEDQVKELVHILESNEIVCVSAKVSSKPITEGMDEYFIPYDLTDRDDRNYLLIVTSDEQSFTALLNDEDYIVEGLISDGSLPSWFVKYDSKDPRRNGHFYEEKN